MAIAPQVHNHVYTLDDRLHLIAQRIDKSIREPQSVRGHQFMARDLAVEIVRGCPQHGSQGEDCQVARVFWYIKNNVEYRQDPSDYDQYMGLGKILQTGGSDCDDAVIAVCTLLSSIGFRTGAKIISPDGANWHIYAVVGVHSYADPSVIIPLDATQTSSFPGWEPDSRYRRVQYQCDFASGKAVNLRKV